MTEQRDIDRLVSALDAQTKALNDLASSNRQVVDLLIAREADYAEDDEKPSATYLDGEPAR